VTPEQICYVRATAAAYACSARQDKAGLQRALADLMKTSVYVTEDFADVVNGLVEGCDSKGEVEAALLAYLAGQGVLPASKGAL
jgi:hypothetical protein